MKTSRKNILVAFILNATFTIIELIGGLLTNSISILSDSIHDFGDSISIGLAYFLEKKSEKGPTKSHTYGYARYSVLSAFITNTVLLIGSIFVIYGAIERLLNPVKVNSLGMIILAIVGILFNGFAVIKTAKSEKLNEKSINLHLLEDVLSWCVVLIGSLFMLIFNTSIIDPIMSLLVVVFIMYNVIKNFIGVFNIFMEKAPKSFDTDSFKNTLLKHPEIKDIHHIHAHTLNGEDVVVSLHAVVDKNAETKDVVKVKNLIHLDSEKYKISHLTIQIDYGKNDCEDLVCTQNFTYDNHHHHEH